MQWCELLRSVCVIEDLQPISKYGNLGREMDKKRVHRATAPSSVNYLHHCKLHAQMVVLKYSYDRSFSLQQDGT